MFIVKKIIKHITLIALLLMTPLSFAQEVMDVKKVQLQIEKLVGENVIQSITETEHKGVFLFEDNRGSLALVYAVGDLVLIGEGYDVEAKLDILATIREKKMVDAVSELSADNFVEIGPEDATRYITVFTDIDCGFCRKLHFEVLPDLAEQGIKTRYILWPRSGLGTKSHEKAITAFCSENRTEAMDILKGGKDLPKIECENPIESLFVLGQKAGVKGTPTIITDNGVVIGGYMPADRIIATMGVSQ